MTFERGALSVVVSATPTGDLTGLQLAPADAAEPITAWEWPAYAEPERFDEYEVTLGSGPLAVTGTLSLTRAAGPLPAIVLLAGSGPLDRDETIGRNKPFKDLVRRGGGLSSLGRFVVDHWGDPGHLRWEGDVVTSTRGLGSNSDAALRRLRANCFAALVRASLTRRPLLIAATGIAAMSIVAAWLSGARFVGAASDASSLVMANAAA